MTKFSMLITEVKIMLTETYILAKYGLGLSVGMCQTDPDARFEL